MTKPYAYVAVGIVAKIVVLMAALSLRPAAAQTDEIQVYDAEITDVGKFNLTWHNNFIASGRDTPDFPGGIVPHHALNGVPEWAYGISEWFEAGAYIPIYTIANGGHFLFDGAKLRALFVVPNAHDRSFFYGMNFEFSYNAQHWDPSRYSAEIRPIVGWRSGRIDIIVNPILDTSFDGIDNLDFAPAMRVAYNASEKWAFALEHYADFGPLRKFLPHDEQEHTLFAVVDFSGAPTSIEFGIGHGFTSTSDATVVKLMFIHDF
jgi:hypothetical protein